MLIFVQPFDANIDIRTLTETFRFRDRAEQVDLIPLVALRQVLNRLPDFVHGVQAALLN